VERTGADAIAEPRLIVLSCVFVHARIPRAPHDDIAVATRMP
jgi:hypothetical protein